MELYKTYTNIADLCLKIKKLPILEGNSLSVNFLLLLGLLAFAVITIDFDTELSVQKDEISQVVATLDESINSVQLDAHNDIKIEPPLVGFIPPIVVTNPDNDVLSHPSDRAPPHIA